MTSTIQIHQIFDRKFLKTHRNRVSKHFSKADFLPDFALENIIDKLQDTDKNFDTMLYYGTNSPKLAELLAVRDFKAVTRADLAAKNQDIIFDEELNPFAEHSFDLIVSQLSLHKVNDLPGALKQYQRTLKKGGIFFASLYGGETLASFKKLLIDCEIELGIDPSPKIYPFIHIKDMGYLLQRVSFGFPVIDQEEVTVQYDSIYKLFADLRYMNEVNCLTMRARKPLRRDFLELLDQKFKQELNGEVNFQIIYITSMRN